MAKGEDVSGGLGSTVDFEKVSRTPALAAMT